MMALLHLPQADMITSHEHTCTPWTSRASYAAWQQRAAADAELWGKSETNDDTHLLSLALQLLQGLQTICQLLDAIHCSPSVCTIRSYHMALLEPVPFCSQQQSAQHAGCHFALWPGIVQMWLYLQKQTIDSCRRACCFARCQTCTVKHSPVKHILRSSGTSSLCCIVTWTERANVCDCCMCENLVQHCWWERAAPKPEA